MVCVISFNKVEIDLSTTSSTKNQQPDTHMLVLPYKGIQGEHPLKYIKSEISKVLPEDTSMQLVYTGTKLGIKFNVKNKTKKEHHRDLTYIVICPMKNRLESCNGETGRRLIE